MSGQPVKPEKVESSTPLQKEDLIGAKILRRMSRKCWNCKQAVRFKDGTVTCIPLSRLERKVINLPKGATADSCQAFEPRPKGYKLPKNFRLFI
jgi:hypothetical protein